VSSLFLIDSHFVMWFLCVIHRDRGLTPKIPENCPEKLRDVMRMCWQKDPNERPVSFLFYILSIQIKNSLVVHSSINTKQSISLSLIFFDFNG
jgi:hypothetical protein